MLYHGVLMNYFCKLITSFTFLFIYSPTIALAGPICDQLDGVRDSLNKKVVQKLGCPWTQSDETPVAPAKAPSELIEYPDHTVVSWINKPTSFVKSQQAIEEDSSGGIEEHSQNFVEQEANKLLQEGGSDNDTSGKEEDSSVDAKVDETANEDMRKRPPLL